MIALWGALKSCLKPGDRVLSVATGVFGHGIADMAKSIGAVVKTYDYPYNQTICDWDNLEKAVVEFSPKMITAVHCETPSGTLNPIQRLGEIKARHEIPLLYVDAVASVGGAPVLADDWHIDLALGGSQKCLSVPPAMAFLSVSQRAWEIIREVNYVGYDALKPFQTAQETFYFPYTPYWHGMAALNAGTRLLLEEGLENSIARHEKVAVYCRQRIEEMGLSLFVEKGAIPSPTVTAVNLPEHMTWSLLNTALRERGMVVGGSYGPLHEKVFRLGHMGSQADMQLVDQALNVLQEVIN
jgi:aspartate aminotransferase-like enzyme